MTAKFRHNTAVPIAGFVSFLGALAFTLQRWWLLPILLIPLGFMWWGFRAGVDVDHDSLRVHGMLGTRTVSWADVTGFRTIRNRVRVLLANGNELPLPAVTPTVLPALIAASGQELTAQ